GVHFGKVGAGGRVCSAWERGRYGHKQQAHARQRRRHQTNAPSLVRETHERHGSFLYSGLLRASSIYPRVPLALAGYATLTAGSPIRIAAGEEDASVYAFEELIERGGVAVVQPDISRAGGLTESRRIAELAHRRGCSCVPHKFSTGILTAASLHLNA